MAADLNRVTVIGRLTRDPELRHTGGGDAICSMRIAVSSRKRDENGEWSDTPNFFDVTVFGKRGETASEWLAKGKRVGIDGRLAWREWQAQDGSKRQSVEIIANDVFFLTPRSEDEGGGAPRSADDLAPAASPPRQAPADDSDIPF